MPGNLERVAYELAQTESLIKNMYTGHAEVDLALRKVAARLRRIERMLRRDFDVSPPNPPEIFDADGYPR